GFSDRRADGEPDHGPHSNADHGTHREPDHGAYGNTHRGALHNAVFNADGYAHTRSRERM
ncbi:MAG: hypothetical protein JRD03_10705, partial [Deltaproteobacteria bacterium]|nr:hypothetical protein [Deltaproteobacteria bacterium]